MSCSACGDDLGDTYYEGDDGKKYCAEDAPEGAEKRQVING